MGFGRAAYSPAGVPAHPFVGGNVLTSGDRSRGRGIGCLLVNCERLAERLEEAFEEYVTTPGGLSSTSTAEEWQAYFDRLHEAKARYDELVLRYNTCCGG